MHNPEDYEDQELEFDRAADEARAEDSARWEPPAEPETAEQVAAREALAGARLKALKVESLLGRAIDDAFGTAGAFARADSAPRAAKYLRELRTYLETAATVVAELEAFAATLPAQAEVAA